MTATYYCLVSSKVRIHYSSNKASWIKLAINIPICSIINQEVHQLKRAVHPDQEEVDIKVGNVPIRQGNTWSVGRSDEVGLLGESGRIHSASQLFSIDVIRRLLIVIYVLSGLLQLLESLVYRFEAPFGARERRQGNLADFDELCHDYGLVKGSQLAG